MALLWFNESLLRPSPRLGRGLRWGWRTRGPGFQSLGHSCVYCSACVQVAVVSSLTFTGSCSGRPTGCCPGSITGVCLGLNSVLLQLQPPPSVFSVAGA